MQVAVEQQQPPVARRRRRPRAVLFFSLSWLALLALVALTASWLPLPDPDTVDVGGKLADPSSAHWLGTDHLGRDVLARLVFSARIELPAPLLAIAITGCLGLPLGLIAGYAGGAVDFILSRIADGLMSIPPLVLALALVAALGPSIVNAMIAIGIVHAPRLFRVVRGSALSARQKDYVRAATGFGARPVHIVWYHMLPSVAPAVLVQLALMMGFTLLAESSLSFLGLGAQPPASTWGVMMGQAFPAIHDTPMLMVYPGICVALTILAFNLVGDSLRDRLDRNDR